MDPLNLLYVAVVVLVLFGASIFVHEFGHYWMALRRRLIVQGFSIGFGPKIVGWRDRHGVDWALRWIPAGGFVKLPQMITSEAIEGKAAEEIPPASPWSRILVAVAGPVMNLAFALLIACVIWLIGVPMLVNPSIVGRVAPDSPEGRLGVRTGDRIVAINGHPVKSWEEIKMEVITSRTDTIPATLRRGEKTFTVNLPTERSETLGGIKWLTLEPMDRPVVGEPVPGGPAQQAGVQSGDKILSFAGVPVLAPEHMIELVDKNSGKPGELVVERGGKEFNFTLTPRFDEKVKRALIGISFAGGHYEIQRPGPAPLEQFRGVFRMMARTLFALRHSEETGVGLKDLSGPVGILPTLAVHANIDFRLALKFMVMLNINLALLNLLPLPVLDGGHITMALYELITRRKVSLRFQEYATTAFAMVLISFMLYVTFYDVQRLPLFGHLLKQKTVIEQAGSPSSVTNALGPATTSP